MQTLKLLLPALIPSWRFFAVIEPSPRIEFTLPKSAHDTADHWQEFRPRPARLSLRRMLKRLFWNARWNESLFLVSCAERLMQNPTEHSKQEILKRIKRDVKAAPYLQFRLVFVDRQGERLEKEVTFLSPVYRHCENT